MIGGVPTGCVELCLCRHSVVICFESAILTSDDVKNKITTGGEIGNGDVGRCGRSYARRWIVS
jgi:hypothetical protein